MLRENAPSIRPFLLATGLQTLLTGTLCFVPLFNLLGYEYCFAVTLLTAITAPLLGFHGDSPRQSLGTSIKITFARSLAQLLPGLCLISLNALRIRNCDFSAGLQFFALMPIATALYGATLGVTASRLSSSWGSRVRRILIALVVIGPLFLCFMNLYLHPPIFVCDHLWGYFSGSLYDEGISPNHRLPLFRAATLLRMILLLGALALWERRHSPLLSGRLLPAALVVGILLCETFLGPRWGYHVKRNDILQQLSVQVELPGLVLHLPPGLSPAVQERVVEDHAFQWEQLASTLKLPLKELHAHPIHSFVYKNSAQKEALMGGATTMVAKPWLHEIHIHGTSFPHSVMPHELVHALAAHFGSPLLKVSARYGLLVNLPLVEGLAEALAPRHRELDLDHYARAMRNLKMAPDLRALFGPAGFWSHAPQRAYAIAGSFVHYLIQEHGVDKLKEVYPHGDFASVYQVPLDTLVSQWEAHVDSLPLPEENRAETRERFRQRSIFKRPCAHVISGLRQKARQEAPGNAVKLYEEITNHLGGSPSARLELAQAQLRAERKEAFQANAATLLAEGGLSRYQRAKLLELQGNERWRAHKTQEAREAFEEVQQIRMDPNSRRLQWVRLWALDQPRELSTFIQRYLEREVPTNTAVLRMKEFMDTYPGEATLPYLIARQLAGSQSWDKAIDYLEQARNHPAPVIEAERIRLLGDCLWNAERYAAAAEAYRRYGAIAPTTGETQRAAEWVRRIEWKVKTEAP